MASLRRIRESKILRETSEDSHQIDFSDPDWVVPGSKKSSPEPPVPTTLPQTPQAAPPIYRANEYINPDMLFKKRGSITFLFTTEEQMYYGDDRTQHYQLIGMCPELVRDRYRLYKYYKSSGLPLFENSMQPVEHEIDFDTGFSNPRSSSMLDLGSFDLEDPPEPSSAGTDDNWGEPREVAIKMGDLVGRLGKEGTLVSFWNTELSAYTHLLRKCLDELIAAQQIYPIAYISTPIHGTIPIDLIETTQTHEMTPEEQEHLELAKQMHLMRGDQKKDAMKKLGVGGGGKPHPMQSAMDDAGLRVPGQKWWAPTSEDFDRKLSMALAVIW